MEMTRTCAEALHLLRSYGVTSSQLDQLLKDCSSIAALRGTDKVAFRHLLIARGLPWGRAVVTAEGGLTVPQGGASDE